jgi:hypothetical protein
MSSPSNKPYKSRLLNLINRYYIKLQSQVNVKFRELGYAIQGGLQKAILPFFWLFQSGKKNGQVFSSATDAHLLEGNQAHIASTQTSDQLIEIAHQNIRNNPLFSSLFPSQFQGLASKVKDKSIVVILTKNKVKNIIPQIKQDDLKFIINRTIAQNSKLVPKTAHKKYYQLSSIFSLSNSKQTQNQSSENNELIDTLDTLVSQVENLINKNSFFSTLNNKQIDSNQQTQNNLSWLKSEALKDIMETSNHKLQEVLPIVKEKTANIVVKGVDQIQIVTNKFHKSIEEDPFQIRILIAEAINYFFNQQKGKHLYSSLNHKLLKSFHHLEIMKIDEQTNEPWLSWEDLYGEQKLLPADNLPNIFLTQDQDNNLPKTIDLTPELVTLIDINGKEDSSNNTEDKLIHIATITNNNLTTELITNSPLLSHKRNQFQSLDKIPKSQTKKIVKANVVAVKNTLTTKKEETIEAKVIEIKYEKHLLEIILEKLDKIILLLEEIIVKLVNVIKIIIANLKKKSN